MNLPGLYLHPLKGKRKKEWAVKISGKWRITFKLENGDAFDVNYEDYHLKMGQQSCCTNSNAYCKSKRN
jgi:hypothetical protein